jgi:hypothetical protein
MVQESVSDLAVCALQRSWASQLICRVVKRDMTITASDLSNASKLALRPWVTSVAFRFSVSGFMSLTHDVYQSDPTVGCCGENGSRAYGRNV